MNRDEILRNLNWEGVVDMLSAVDDVEQSVMLETLSVLFICSLGTAQDVYDRLSSLIGQKVTP